MRLLRTILMAAVLSGMLLVAASCGSRQRTAEQTLRELSAPEGKEGDVPLCSAPES